MQLSDDGRSARAWANHAWPWFRDRTGRRDRMAVLPLAACADHGLGGPLDAESVVLRHVLRLAADLPAHPPGICVLPVTDHLPAVPPAVRFGHDPALATEAATEIARGVRAAGFARLALVNASPWHEEWVAGLALDLRLATRLAVAFFHLSVAGLDFHPLRAPVAHRTGLQHVLARLQAPCAAPPAARPAAPRAAIPAGRPLALRHPGLLVPPARPDPGLAETLLAAAADRLAAFLAAASSAPLPPPPSGAGAGD